jgi:hypothetical protein
MNPEIDEEQEDRAGVEYFWRCIAAAARPDDDLSEARQLRILEKLWGGPPFEVRREGKVIAPIRRRGE